MCLYFNCLMSLDNLTCTLLNNEKLPNKSSIQRSDRVQALGLTIRRGGTMLVGTVE